MATNKGAFLAITGLAAVALAFAAARVDVNNPTGTHGLIVIDKIGRHVRFFDPSNFQEISSLEVGVAPHDVAISPDHKFAYIPVYGDGVYGRNPNPGHTIAIIDLTSRQVAGTIDVSPYQAPHGIQIDDAGKIYVTCDLSRKLLVIDPKTRSIEAALDTEGTGHWAAVLPDASKAYVVNKNDKLYRHRDRSEEAQHRRAHSGAQWHRRHCSFAGRKARGGRRSFRTQAPGHQHC